jgi:transcriptional regulator with XRE-family HTH domain
MTGEEFKALRISFGFSQDQLALYLGYSGNHSTNRTTMDRYETGKRIVPPYIARLMWLIERYRLVHRSLPLFPDWQTYDDDEIGEEA